MDRTIWAIRKFTRRSLRKGTLAIRNTVAAGVSVLQGYNRDHAGHIEGCKLLAFEPGF